MRPGNNASSILKRSATTSGAWLGNITPPEPTRMLLGHGGDLPDHQVGCGACDRRQIVVLGKPVTDIAQAIDMLRQVDAVAQRRSGPGARGDDGEIEDGERNHGG